MAHCRALVIQCMDFRFQTAVREYFLSSKLTDQYDLVSIAGAGKTISEGGARGEFLLDLILRSRELHGISELHLVHHLDCGAYGGSAEFGSYQEEYQRHISDMAASEKVIKQRFPSLRVFKKIAHINDGKVEFDTVT